MGAKVLDHAIIESNVIVGAGALVLENMICESGFLYAGVPAKKIKPLTEEQIRMLATTAENYILYSSWFTDK
jgi:acetyltransferase-like isoleucine patch superfamily enzyme